MAAPPSGEQFEIFFKGMRATIVEVGGGVRAFSDGAREVLEPYEQDSVCDGAHGAVLIPWPNRIGGGRYSFDGSEQRLALSEPAKGNAIHGLLRWTAWSARERERERVLMGARLHPQPGYPFDLDVTVEYTLGAGGLRVSTRARNLGARACPYGAGQHPYLSPGVGRIDDCKLELPARTLIATDPERRLPSERETLAGGPLDFRAPRALGAVAIDSPFTDLDRDEDGLAWARLTAPDSSRVELWVDEGYPVLEVFTGDTLAADRRRTGLAVEPMTCPPNAFQSADMLIRLEPGESHLASWGARLAAA
jgi:aldose 1-epimerase